MSSFSEARPQLGKRLLQLNWGMVLLIIATAGVGFAMLYSAAGGNLDPWASRQVMRFSVGLALMFFVALVDLRVWRQLSYPAYALGILLLIAVEFVGASGGGAQRWIDLGVMRLQPSEVMKIALVMALARYFHGVPAEETGRIHHLIVPIVLVAVPVAMVVQQPDLGTALVLAMIGGAMLWLAGVGIWLFVVVGGAGLAAIPVVWQFLHDYQRARILTFLRPENDPLGAGYHILQSKIALGSGGLLGKGFLQGTQSHLNFLPEKQTDFVFTMLAEEFGLVGGLGLLVLYLLLMVYGIAISLRCRNQFGRLLAAGLTASFFLYVFINIAMVMGLIPVVGVPLPLISYGGTAMLAVLIGFGLLMSTHTSRDTPAARYGNGY